MDVDLAISGMMIQIEAKSCLGLKTISISASKYFRDKVIKDWESTAGKEYGDKTMGIFYLHGIPLIEAEHLLMGFILHFSDGSHIFMHQ